jgi:hypothetical protein
MANPLTSPAFVKALQNELREMQDEARTLNDINEPLDQLFDVITDSNRAWEEYSSVSALGDIPRFNGRLTTLGITPGYSTKIEPAEFAAKIVMERKLFDDLQYDILMRRAENLMASALRVRNKNKVAIFGNATSTAFDFMPSQEEGVALASTAHTTKVSGVSTTSGFSNLGTSALNAVSVAAARIIMRKFRQSNGERIDVGNNFALLVPDDLEFKAQEIVRTDKQVDSANNNANIQKGLYTIINSLRLSDYSTSSWSLINMSTAKDDFKWIQRANAETNDNVDFNTLSMENSVYERHAGGFVGWRSFYHSNVT